MKLYSEKVLNTYNLLSIRKLVESEDIKDLGLEMERYIAEQGAKKNSSIITTVHDVKVINENTYIDYELLIPINKVIKVSEPYILKKELKIVNAIMVEEKNMEANIQDIFKFLSDYIRDNGLIPLTPMYSVIMDSEVINIYVGLNPNIL